MNADYHAGSRQAWLKLLRLCLDELRVDEQTAFSILWQVDPMNSRQQMVVHEIKQVRDELHYFGADSSFYVIGPLVGPRLGDKTHLLGKVITYIADGPDHGYLVEESSEG